MSILTWTITTVAAMLTLNTRSNICTMSDVINTKRGYTTICPFNSWAIWRGRFHLNILYLALFIKSFYTDASGCINYTFVKVKFWRNSFVLVFPILWAWLSYLFSSRDRSMNSCTATISSKTKSRTLLSFNFDLLKNWLASWCLLLVTAITSTEMIYIFLLLVLNEGRLCLTFILRSQL